MDKPEVKRNDSKPSSYYNCIDIRYNLKPFYPLAIIEPYGLECTPKSVA
jgi:hypothetical protein